MSDMQAKFERLRHIVLDEVEKERMRQEGTPDPARQMIVLGHFISASMERQQLTPDSLANALDIKPELVDMLLNGELPVWMLNDEALHRIASVINHEPNVLRVMLNRGVQPLDASQKS